MRALDVTESELLLLATVRRIAAKLGAPATRIGPVDELLDEWLAVKTQLALQCEGRGLDDLVFGDHGAYLPRPKSSNGWFTRAAKAAVVQAITPHDLRHTCASLAVSAGVNVLALSRMLGHTSAKVTLDTDADLFDTDLDAVASALYLKCAHSVPKARPVGTVGG